MKKITLLLLLVGITSWAQIRGNKNITTQTFSVEQLTDIEISLYADVIINQSAKDERMEITTDSNLFDLIDTEVVNGTLKLNQKEWVQASQRIQIRIGAPSLRRVLLSTNDKVEIVNLNSKKLSLMALNGEIVASGKSANLGVGCENGTVNVGNVTTEKVYLNIWGHGKALINATELLEATLSTESKLILTQQPKEIKGNVKRALANAAAIENMDARYISFKIVNNSENRNHFYVIGRKPDGGNFSYGFPMMPGNVRKEKWTTGTKIYKVNRIGLRKLLVTITDKDEAKTVRLF